MVLGFRRWFLILLGITLAGSILAVGPIRREVLRAAGRVLVVDGAVDTADAIVLPEWAGPEGAIEAADLVHASVSNHVAIVAAPRGTAERELTRRGVSYHDEAANLSQLLNALGVVSVEVLPVPAEGTEAEGQVLPLWCEQHGLQSIVVVSTPDHSRRINRVLRRSMRSIVATKVTIRSAHYSSFDPDGWWRTRDGTRTEIVELEKLLLDVARHPTS
jgi:hypothetical protein